MFCGCQFSLYPMSDNFVEVILPAVEAMRSFAESYAGEEDTADPKRLRIETDDISTLVVGPPSAVFSAVGHAYEAACRAGGHVVLSALFSRGCPGEPDDPICTPEGPATGATREGAAQQKANATAGVEIDAQFSLYPLGVPHYMESIAGAVETAKQAGVFDRSKHFCTRLSGDLADIFAAVERCFAVATRDTGHVVIHLTASKGSPSSKSRSSSQTKTHKE